MSRDGYAYGAVHPGQLFDDSGVFHVAEARAAVLVGDEHTHESELGKFLQNVAWEDLLFVPFVNVRADFFLRKLADDTFDFKKLFAVVKFHISNCRIHHGPGHVAVAAAIAMRPGLFDGIEAYER